jgi:hypothetical protein
MKAMTPKEFKEEMRKIFPVNESEDTESAHGSGDALLCEVLRSLGYGDGVKIFEEADKWYG